MHNVDAGELGQALDLLLKRIAGADKDERERIRRLSVALFTDLGTEHSLALRYRRRLDTALC